jgi:hypothetical protein
MNNSAPTGQVFMKLDIWEFIEHLSKKSNFRSNLTRITGILREYLCTFIIISNSILLRMRNVSDKSCSENQNIHFMSNNFFSKNRAIYDHVDKHGRARQATYKNKICCMCTAYWIIKATDTLRICSAYCFSTTTMVMQMGLNITLYVLCLSYLLLLLHWSCTTNQTSIPIGYLLQLLSLKNFAASPQRTCTWQLLSLNHKKT